MAQPGPRVRVARVRERARRLADDVDAPVGVRPSRPAGRSTAAAARLPVARGRPARTSSSVTSGGRSSTGSHRGTGRLRGWRHAARSGLHRAAARRPASPPTSPTTGWPRRSARRRTARSGATRPSPRCGVRRRAGRSTRWSGCSCCRPPVGREDADRALPGLVDRLCNAGLLEQSVSEVAARMDCRPYATERPRPLGRLRPDAGPRRRAGRRRPRPRARHLERVDEPGPADDARAGRLARSTSAPAAASRPSTWPATPAASWRPTSTAARSG